MRMNGGRWPQVSLRSSRAPKAAGIVGWAKRSAPTRFNAARCRGHGARAPLPTLLFLCAHLDNIPNMMTVRTVCSRGALLKGAFEVEQDVAPAGVGRTYPHALGRSRVAVRPHYGGLPLKPAGLGQASCGKPQGATSQEEWPREQKSPRLRAHRRRGPSQGGSRPL